MKPKLHVSSAEIQLESCRDAFKWLNGVTCKVCAYVPECEMRQRNK